ncbi:type IV toxin-antitoxin system AbiEi family antitoxin domain-containing protein [Nostocoides sp. Soil756]|uniref:type IV toxin-antitoxin system AbiEi family antitoxin domain-containing protein n=1 Tax=Nostocoides sp. Soil756 TaxID=1736399 RepID=UPI0006FF06A2|nr:type IV toxin-antitoxin system AbiEi family antitoxin domain-containing protein [Tetrasphaera sp. Soil756]KRE62730.1 hypothetical protein ASG78_06995 [Tetrasphaera sp. Soil756]
MDELTLLAQLHDGVFTTAEAVRLGVCGEVLMRSVRAGHIRRLARGLYAIGACPESPEDRHRELCRALRVEYPDAVLGGRSAVVAHGLPVWGVPLASALLLRPVERQVRRSGATVRLLSPVTTVVGTPTGSATTPASALVQVALDHGCPAAVVSADAALHRGLVSTEDLAVEVSERGGHRHVQRAVAMLAFVDGTSESPGESRLRVALTAAGFDLEPQFDVRDVDGDLVGRADFRVAGTRVLVEFDGLVKYTDGGPEALVREKRREDRLRALGWVVVRVTWAELADPPRLFAAVRRAMALAASLAA